MSIVRCTTDKAGRFVSYEIYIIGSDGEVVAYKEVGKELVVVDKVEAMRVVQKDVDYHRNWLTRRLDTLFKLMEKDG